MSTFCRTNNSSICSMSKSRSKSRTKGNSCHTEYTLIKGNIQKPIEKLDWSDIFVTKNVSGLEDPKITTKIMINNNPYFIKYCCSTCMDDLFYEFLVGAILTKIGLPHIPKVYMYLSETEKFYYDDKTLFLKDNMDKQQYCVKKQHAIIEEYIEGEQLSKILDANRKIEILKKIVDLQTQYPYIIHNDLHINNILIGKDNTPYIIDLGRVRLINYQLPNEVQSEFNLLDKMIQTYSTNNCFFRLYDYQSTLKILQIQEIGVFNHLVNQNFFLYPILKYCCNVKAIDEDYYQILTHNINSENVKSENDLFQLLISNIQTLLKRFDRNRSKSITKTHKRKHRSVKKSVSRSKKSKTRKIMKNPKPWIPPGRRIT